MSQIKLNGKSETLCIFGNPIGHSKSPLMHNALFEALGINAAYVPFSPEPQNLADAIKGFRALKIRGANVTIPYKTPVMELVDELSDISRFTCSVNTLYWKNGIVGGTLCGTTTDPYGCIRNLEEFGVNVSGKKVALLGNGGAAKAIAYTLVEKKCELTIVCRTAEKGQALANMLNMAFNDSAPQVMMVTFDDFAAITDSIDIIINATSVGMTPNVDDSPLPREELRPHQAVCDIVYTPLCTKLLQLADEVGCKVVTGEGMLVHQGIESFRKWFPKESETKTNDELAAIMRKGMQG
ncbi:MAG: shikimate dehydrogenase [Fibrobacter sp.]|nr:shikimate dehydrogenase [Fibrobacter sp.]